MQKPTKMSKFLNIIYHISLLTDVFNLEMKSKNNDTNLEMTKHDSISENGIWSKDFKEIEAFKTDFSDSNAKNESLLPNMPDIQNSSNLFIFEKKVVKIEPQKDITKKPKTMQLNVEVEPASKFRSFLIDLS